MKAAKFIVRVLFYVVAVPVMVVFAALALAVVLVALAFCVVVGLIMLVASTPVVVLNTVFNTRIDFPLDMSEQEYHPVRMLYVWASSEPAQLTDEDLKGRVFEAKEP